MSSGRRGQRKMLLLGLMTSERSHSLLNNIKILSAKKFRSKDNFLSSAIPTIITFPKVASYELISLLKLSVENVPWVSLVRIEEAIVRTRKQSVKLAGRLSARKPCVISDTSMAGLTSETYSTLRVQRLSQDNPIKQRRAWLLLGWVTTERFCPCKQPDCPAIGGGSEV
ncbi:hypothetical protein J6590_011286 [Homalodisca vitripennis]|nr:hypothetical protein J6590_011286 [Homalodisca vitripennis]